MDGGKVDPPTPDPPAKEAFEDDVVNMKTENAFNERIQEEAADNTIPLLVGVAVGLLTLLLIYLISKRRSLGRGELCKINQFFSYSFYVIVN